MTQTPATAPKEFRVFFSWQSDSPKQTNTNAIRKALQAAQKKAKASGKLTLALTEATSRMAGSGNIPEEIRRNIAECDIFIADVTTVNTTAKGVRRKTPNPNVLFELGYAVAQVGWNRIILLTNTALCRISDLPFDIDRHRVSGYKYASGRLKAIEQKKVEGNLQGLLMHAISTIAEQNPPKPPDLRGVDPPALKQKRDVFNLRRIFESFSLNSISDLANALPDVVTKESFFFYENFKDVYGSGDFYLYDSKAKDLLRDFFEAWNHVYDFSNFFEGVGGETRFTFSKPPSKREEAAYSKLDKARQQLMAKVQTLRDYVIEKFVEVDISSASAKAEDAYTKHVEYTKSWLY
jgi:hypothetical protein